MEAQILMHWAGRVTVVLAIGVAAFLAGRWTAPDGATSAAGAIAGDSAHAARPGGDPSARDGGLPGPADDAAPRDRRAARAEAAPSSAATEEDTSADEEIPADFGGPPAADITGTLLDRSGNPVADAAITATPSELMFEEDGERERRILERITPANTLRARSDAEGRYRLVGTRTSLRYDVHPSLAFRSFETTTRTDDCGVLPGAVVDFIATRLGSVRLDVLMPDGTPPPNADVDFRWKGAHDSDREWWTPESPVLSVVPGTVEISVSYGAYGGQIAAVAVIEGAEVRTSVRLEQRGTVRVRVTFPPGLDPRSVYVWATPDDDVIGSQSGAAPVDLMKGIATLEGLAFGRWCIVAKYRSGRVAVRDVVDVGKEVREIAWNLPPEDKRDFVTVRVLDAAGAPVTDAIVTGTSIHGSAPVGGDVEALGIGLFRLRHNGFDDPADTRFRASVESPTLGSKTVEYAGGVDEEIVIRLPAVATVTIRVPAGEGGDRWTSVRIAPELPRAEWDGARVYAAGGKARFEHVPHGTWLVRAEDFPGTAMRITVPCAGEVEYRGEPLRAWRVSDVEAGGRAAAAGLRAGDLIIGVGKAEFRDDRHREALWAAASLEERPVAIVLRGARRESIPLDPESISPGYIAGAALDPALR